MLNRLVMFAAVVFGGGVVATGCVCAPDYHTDSGYAANAEFGPMIDQCESRLPCEPLCAAKFHLDVGQIDKCVLGRFDASGAIVTVHYHEEGVCGSDDDDGGYYDDDGTWVDDSGDDGSTDDGSTDDGSNDGSTGDGSTDDGSTDDGSTGDGGDDGSTGDGGDDGSTDDGGDDGSTDDGGWTDDGGDDGSDDGDDWKRGAAHAKAPVHATHAHAHAHAPRGNVSVVR